MENSPNTRSDNNLLRKVVARFVPYTLIIFAISASLPAVVEHGDVIVFEENGPVEWLQFTIMLVSAVVLLLYSRLEGYGSRELFTIIALVQVAVAIREMDDTFDQFVPFIGWESPFIICILTGILFYWRRKNAISIQMDTFIRTRAFSLLWCGFIVTVPFAQLVGHGDFLKLLMGNDYVRDFKRVIEELGELLGYLLILIGSFEAVLQQKEKQNDNSNSG